MKSKTGLETWHITPKGDEQIEREHEESLLCWCGPTIKYEPLGTFVLHNVLVAGDWWDVAREALPPE